MNPHRLGRFLSPAVLGVLVVGGVWVLGEKVLLAACIFAGFVGCLGNAVRLVLKGQEDAGIAFWVVGSAGILGLTTFGLPIIFDLF